MEYTGLEGAEFYTAEGLGMAEDTYNKIQEAWITYASQPVNFGTEPDPIAERDAFFAGAVAMLGLKIPF